MQRVNPGTFIGLGIAAFVIWQFAGWWTLIPIALAVLMYPLLIEDHIRKRNARKMRRELRMESRMGLAAEYAKRHPDKA